MVYKSFRKTSKDRAATEIENRYLSCLFFANFGVRSDPINRVSSFFTFSESVITSSPLFMLSKLSEISSTGLEEPFSAHNSMNTFLPSVTNLQIAQVVLVFPFWLGQVLAK
jgi:hypothetical protein